MEERAVSWNTFKYMVEHCPFATPVWWVEEWSGEEDHQYYLAYKSPKLPFLTFCVLGDTMTSEIAEFEAWTDHKSNDYKQSTRNDAITMAMAYASPPVSQSFAPQVEEVPRMGAPGEGGTMLLSHHFGDRTTWWQQAVKYGTTESPELLEVVSDTGGLTWRPSNSGNRVWLNIRHAKLTLPEINAMHGTSWYPVACLQRNGSIYPRSAYFVRFFKRTIDPQGSWTELSESSDLDNIVYASGQITVKSGSFNPATEELGAVYWVPSTDNTFILTPITGQIWIITRSEINRSAGAHFDLNGACPMFEQWQDSGKNWTDEKYIQRRADYGTMYRLQDTAVGANTLLLAGGGSNTWAPCANNGWSSEYKQGLQYDAEILKWGFDEAGYVLHASDGDALKLYTEGPNLLISDYCSYTFYVKKTPE